MGAPENPAKAVLGLPAARNLGVKIINGGVGEVLHQTPKRCGGGRDVRHDGMRRPGACLGMESRAEEATPLGIERAIPTCGVYPTVPEEEQKEIDLNAEAEAARTKDNLKNYASVTDNPEEVREGGFRR